ncbi:hypothetical protein [Bosea sp. (in: a-proteobacteria)]|uniref:Uncharacterized protein n=1 Tax=Bosea vestrisii TaxID=151416 RepID=A0ABW0HDX0_9HYPH|nr:hypothetical protein [Bosea sp. (in: a-proteobacteria)]MBR3194348.1 hypothetical protein [Bosea sp. (in: a-proteobacteria)]
MVSIDEIDHCFPELVTAPELRSTDIRSASALSFCAASGLAWWPTNDSEWAVPEMQPVRVAGFATRHLVANID